MSNGMLIAGGAITKSSGLLPLEIRFDPLNTYNVTDRDLESDREVEHFVGPHTPVLSRLSHHTSDRGAPRFNMAPTNHAESN